MCSKLKDSLKKTYHSAPSLQEKHSLQKQGYEGHLKKLDFSSSDAARGQIACALKQSSCNGFKTKRNALSTATTATRQESQIGDYSRCQNQHLTSGLQLNPCDIPFLTHKLLIDQHEAGRGKKTVLPEDNVLLANLAGVTS